MSYIYIYIYILVIYIYTRSYILLLIHTVYIILICIFVCGLTYLYIYIFVCIYICQHSSCCCHFHLCHPKVLQGTKVTCRGHHGPMPQFTGRPWSHHMAVADLTAWAWWRKRWHSCCWLTSWASQRRSRLGRWITLDFLFGFPYG